MKLTKLFVSFLALVFAVPTALAAERKFEPMGRRSIDPRSATNASFISVSGTVTSTTPTSFMLDYGTGSIVVEMDDFDVYDEGRAMMENDDVVVFGKIDAETMEKRTIEARTVYVDNLNTQFFASAVDDEDWALRSAVHPVVSVGELVVTGIVAKRSGREFTIDTGAATVQVDTASMPQNPLDDEGYLEIDVGDRVKVGGTIDNAFWDEAELSADWIIEKS